MARWSARRRLLFTADNGVCVAMYRRLTDRLRHDPRLGIFHALYLKNTRASRHEPQPDPRAYLAQQDLGGHVVHYRLGRYLPVDACITPSFNDRLQPRNARLTIQIFHGVSFKNYCIKEKALRFDRLYLPGAYHRRRYVESGLFKEDDPRLVVTGLPKLDCLVNGTLDRDTVLTGLGLDPDLPTVLFAPTGDPGNALNRFGDAIIEQLMGLPINLIVKPHDHPHRDAGCTIEWPARLRAIREPWFHVAFGSDVTPFLAAADLLLTDASSVAFEYTLLDRPIIFMHVPEILEGPRAERFDMSTWGRKGGHIIDRPEELRHAVPYLLSNPSEQSEVRRAIAADLFHEPGRATEIAVRRLYDDLELEPPAALEAGSGREREAPTLRLAGRIERPPRRVASFATAAALLAASSVVVLRVAARAEAIRVPVTAETSSRDLAHLGDLAIWIDPTDQKQNLMICADAAFGMRVFDLAGRPLQELRVGPQRHVDLRQGLDRGDSTIIASSDAVKREVLFYDLDSESRLLRAAPVSRVPVGVLPDGLCLYRSAADDKLYFFVLGTREDDRDNGWVEQHEILLGQDGTLRGAQLVRAFDVGSATEGCVADDENGALYIAEESVGTWRYPAEPGDQGPRVLVDSLENEEDTGGNLRGTVEGLALLRLGNRSGYLIASNTGPDDFVVYHRAGSNDYVNRFSLEADQYVDAVGDSEGLEVASGNLGNLFAEGVLVAQDTQDDRGGSNFKVVSWRAIADALRLR